MRRSGAAACGAVRRVARGAARAVRRTRAGVDPDPQRTTGDACARERSTASADRPPGMSTSAKLREDVDLADVRTRQATLARQCADERAGLQAVTLADRHAPAGRAPRDVRVRAAALVTGRRTVAQVGSGAHRPLGRDRRARQGVVQVVGPAPGPASPTASASTVASRSWTSTGEWPAPGGPRPPRGRRSADLPRRGRDAREELTHLVDADVGGRRDLDLLEGRTRGALDDAHPRPLGGVTKVRATPSRPARPVRPMRCT